MTDTPPTNGSRHTWRNRERIAWFFVATLILTTLLPFLPIDLDAIRADVIKQGQATAALIVAAFVIGKAGVEAVANRKAP